MCSDCEHEQQLSKTGIFAVRTALRWKIINITKYKIRTHRFSYKIISTLNNRTSRWQIASWQMSALFWTKPYVHYKFECMQIMDDYCVVGNNCLFHLLVVGVVVVRRMHREQTVFALATQRADCAKRSRSDERPQNTGFLSNSKQPTLYAYSLRAATYTYEYAEKRFQGTTQHSTYEQKKKT